MTEIEMFKECLKAVHNEYEKVLVDTSDLLETHVKDLLMLREFKDSIDPEALIKAVMYATFNAAQRAIKDHMDFLLNEIDSGNGHLKQKPKTGHWIVHMKDGISHIECSACRVWFLKSHLIRNSFCPNCGVYMRGEVKE